MTVGQDLTAHYVDECVDQGRNEMVRMKGHVARRAKELHDAGVPVEEIKQAITEFVRRRARSPLQLAEISVELVRNESEDPALRPDERKRAKAWIEEHGWPTGARFVRGTHSGTYRYDPLGTDRVGEHDWPHGRPTFDEIVRALA